MALAAPSRGVGAAGRVGPGLLVGHDPHRPACHPAGRDDRAPQPGGVVRGRPRHVGGGGRLARARHRRAVPLRGAHGPAHPAVAGGAPHGPAGHPHMVGPHAGGQRPSLRLATAPGPTGAGHADLQRGGRVHPLAGGGQLLGVQRRPALRRARGGGGLGAAHVDAGGRAPARTTLLAPGPDGLPVPPVGRPHRPRRLAHLRRRRRVPVLRRRAPGVRAYHRPRSAVRRHAHEGGRRAVAVDDHHGAVLPLRHQQGTRRPFPGRPPRPAGAGDHSRRRRAHLGAGPA